MAELVIMIGLPGAGKTSFHRASFGPTHVHVSKDRMRNRRDRQTRQLTLVDQALARGQSVVVDNVNATVADRAALIEVGRRRGAAIIGYVLGTAVGECVRRNRDRAGRERVPDVAVYAAAKRFEPPTHIEGFDRLHRVEAEAGRFHVSETADGTPRTVFLLSPASTSGERAAILLGERATFPLAMKLRSAAGAPLGEVFSFMSGLYFRGKLAYARAFARPPAGLCGAFVITPGEGLRDPAEPVTIARLRRYVEVPVRLDERRYLAPLLRDAGALAKLAGEHCRVVLLGSVASSRYVEPLLGAFGERLVFPPVFVGRGDMSRGGLLLRCVDQGRELEYAPLAGAVRHGPRPPRLPPRARHQETSMTFDLTEATKHLAERDERLGRLIGELPPFQLEAEGAKSPYEALLESIAYQSISGKAAATIYGRVKALGGNGRAPTPEQMLALRKPVLRRAGLSGAKILAMKDLARKTLAGVVPTLEQAHEMSDDELVERLVSVRGIGAWSVEMFLIFRLGRPDVLPIHDLGVKKGWSITYGKKHIPKPKELLAFGERWRPYRTVASWYMWRAFERAGYAATNKIRPVKVRPKRR